LAGPAAEKGLESAEPPTGHGGQEWEPEPWLLGLGPVVLHQ